MRRWILPSLVLVLGVEVLLPVLLFLVRNRLIFLPSDEPRAAEAARAVRGVRAVTYARPDGRPLTGLEAAPSDADADDPVVLFLHGNAGNAGFRAGWLGGFAAGTGLRTFLAGYSGYGGNPGSPSEEELHADALAAFDHLVAEGVAPARIVLYGESLGGAAAARVARERSCRALVIQSGFVSLRSMAWRLYPFLPLAALLAGGRLTTAQDAASVDVPLLLVHGTRDGIVPFSQSEAIRRVAPRAELWPVEGAGHNDLFDVAGVEYLRRLAEWCREAG